MGRRNARGVSAALVLAGVVTLLAPRAAAQIDLDTPATGAALTYSTEFLTTSPNLPRGFYEIGVFASGDDRLRTRATLGPWQLPPTGGGIWLRYDLNAHLVYRGTAPRLFSRRSDPDLPGQTIDLIRRGIAAANAGTFSTDGYLLFFYDPPERLAGRQVKPLPDDTTLELDLANVLASSGLGDGRVRVRAFVDAHDAGAGTNPLRGEKSATVARVAHTLTVAPQEVTQTATVLGFKQFALGNHVPLGGFELRIDGTHRRPDGSPVPSALTEDTLRALNVDVDASSLSFTGDGGFGFAPADGGWTIEGVDPETGLCAASSEDDDATPVVQLGFGPGDIDYPDGPARAGKPPLAGYLCASVPDDNEHPIQEGHYYLDVAFLPLDRTRPFPPTGVMELLIGTIRHQGTEVHIPYLTFGQTYRQRLTIVNRNTRAVQYRLTFRPGQGGTADPPHIEGVAAPGVNTLHLQTLTTLRDTTWASATLTIVSVPGLVDIATVTVNRGDQSTDTVVYRGVANDP